ncbi:MAG: hypothetical protein BWY54_00077 [Candidatus Dependentiae bacterium ADurb.Bin331]|nr:MAG: hypothetical protein BWY54_00077 [Candidatus Dependentiae bacterium ADurb.Bin331]
MKFMQIVSFIFLFTCGSIFSTDFKNILLIINYNHAHYESIDLLKKIYTPYFGKVVFYGPKEHPEIHVCNHHKGYFSYTAIADAMERYPHFEGYLFLMDDCILNPWLLTGIDTKKIWFGDIPFIIQNDGKQINNRGTPIKIKLGKKAITHWAWWQSEWGYEPMKSAFKKLPREQKKILEKNWGKNTVPASFSDLAYIPAMYKDTFIKLALIFAKRKAFLETALPTILSCLTSKNNWFWLQGTGTFYPGTAQSQEYFSEHLHFNHPIKLSYEENRTFIENYFEQHKQ